MTERGPATPHATPDGLWRWLLGGLVGGGIILGLLIAAYAIGYHRGQQHAASPAGTAPAATTALTTTATTTTGQAAAPAPVTSALVAKGKALYAADGCAACHSLTGSPGAGPSFKGLAGSTVSLAGGRTVTAGDTYLEQ